jgi:hypothetical protein
LRDIVALLEKANRSITSDFRHGPGLAVRPGDACEAIMRRLNLEIEAHPV